VNTNGTIGGIEGQQVLQVTIIAEDKPPHEVLEIHLNEEGHKEKTKSP
jgi:hypothetical protein